MKKTLFMLGCVLITHNVFSQSDLSILKKMADQLETLEGVSYFQKQLVSAPFDTTSFTVETRYIKMFFNPNDPYVGSSFYHARSDDTTQHEYMYDGHVALLSMDYDEKVARVDSFLDNKGRNLLTPFFIEARTLARYVLDNPDSVDVQIYEYPDSTQMVFTFRNKYVYIDLKFGEQYKKGVIAQYSLIVNNNTLLPVYLKSKMPHMTTIKQCGNMNILNYPDPYAVADFIPSDFELKKRISYNEILAKAKALKGSKAVAWELPNTDGDTIALDDIKAKATLIQFTTIGCGHCHAAVSFMKELSNGFKEKDVEIISIEFSKSDLERCKEYKKKNDINYNYVLGAKKLANQYGALAAPVFVILDSEKNISDIHFGFLKGYNDEKIKESINRLL